MNTKRVLILGLTVLVVLGLIGATALVVVAYRSPLGPSLAFSSPTPIPVEAAFVAQATPASTFTPVPVQAGVCGETAAWNILVLGSDAADLFPPVGSDLTRVLRVDFPNKRVSMFTFPRDLWVTTEGLGLTNPTVNATTLGRVFYEARIRSSNTEVQMRMVDGATASARMLATNFLVSTDHYLALDISKLPPMVDAIGGVPVDVPATIRDEATGIVIYAGQQTLDGARFAAYARAAPDSDFARIQRDNLLLAALRDKLLDPSVWARIPGLYTQFRDALATDLSPEQINHLSCLLQEVPQESIQQDSVRKEWTWPGPQAGSLSWNTDLVVDRLRELGLTP